MNSKSFDDNFKLYLAFLDNISNMEFNLKTKEITKFQKDFKKLHLFDNYNPKSILDCPLMDNMCKIKIIIHNDNSKNEKYEIVNGFPKMWCEFGMLLNEMLGFDLVNIKNLKFLITDFNFDIKTDGVYLNGNRLKLTKFNYYYRGSFVLYPQSCFSIDFNKKIISGLGKVNLKNYPKIFDYDTILEIKNLIEKYVVYKWYCHEFLFGTVDCHCLDFFDGAKWNIELIFEDKYILHIGGWNYPKNYIKFCQELNNLTNYDLLNIK